MGSSSDEEIQVLLNQFDDDNIEAINLGAGEAKGKKENVRITNVPYGINKGELLDICFIYHIALEYKLIRPSESMRVTEPLDGDSIMIQLHPNSLRLLCDIETLACQDRHDLMAQGVHELCNLYVQPNQDHYFLQERNNCGFGVSNQWSDDPLCHLPASPTPEDLRLCGVDKGHRINICGLEAGMAPKKAKGSKMAEIAKAKKKKAKESRSNQGLPLNDHPSREMFRHCLFHVDTQQFKCMDDLGIRDLANQSLFQAINANNPNYASIKKVKRGIHADGSEEGSVRGSLEESKLHNEGVRAQYKAKLAIRDTEYEELQENF
ncbi:hypothetical protein JCGZ_11879 [Jatropha curcas]|uniref:Uncharacterized protein n=1 Tax=Jatropha curcas TaxID=180498 RepID=A0A067LBW3_JATCU|nr:hypothetical protein JCGZ_11879 [Jatropha curcas]